MTVATGSEAETRLLVVHDHPDAYLDLFRARVPGLRIACCRAAPDLGDALARVQPQVALSYRCAGIPGPDHRAILACPSVRWLHVGGAGVDHLGSWDASRVTVTNSAGVLSPFLADYVLGAILMVTIGFPGYLRQQAERRWQGRPWRPIQDQSLLVVGLGRIGRLVAARARAAGLRVTGIRSRPGPLPEVADVLPPAALHQALAAADFVALHVPLTPATRHLIDAAALARMRPTATLINCSRGAVVDETALVAALARGRIAGAVLDVFEHEPLTPESPLWGFDNVVVTPHVSDSVQGWERRLAAYFCDNLERWLAGRPLENVVDPTRGY